jgi:hypothetical protein
MNANREHMRDESSARKTMKAMLERNDPVLLQQLNLEVLRRLAERHKGVGDCLVIDGTEIDAFVNQTIGVSAEHREHISRGTGATLHSHGDGSPLRRRKRKHWVGFQLIVISDMKTGLPLIWELVNGGEYQHVMRMMKRLLTLAPWLDPIYLVGDAEFDRGARLALDLQQRLNVVPCFPLRKGVSDRYPFARNAGVPTCPKHGAMKYVQANDFAPDVVEREYEPDYEKARRGFDGHIRWRCEACKRDGVKRTATTWARHNPPALHPPAA